MSEKLIIDGKAIKKRRKEKKLTIVEVAIFVGVNEKTIRRLENGCGHEMRVLKFYTLCKLLDLDMYSLIKVKID